jgi:hypothetical protein
MGKNPLIRYGKFKVKVFPLAASSETRPPVLILQMQGPIDFG